MPVPPKRRPSSSKKRRQSHHALSKPMLVACGKCKKLTLPHKACVHCGYYKGKEVVKPRTKAKKASK